MYKKILLPVDVFEMDLSDKAVRHAEFLASADEGEITLLNVLPNSSNSILRGFAADIRKFEAYMREESEKKMKTISRLFSIPAERIHSRVVFGNVRDEILAVSGNEDFDVIVIGSRKPGISTHLLGSNAESILRHAKIPVLVVR
ncbi:Universal stress protein G [Klebsiella michiganensis]|uniref:Universal stress protein n=1 Tax=Klebsiella michiganensis TaxID=1134687 RepID=A0A7H4MYD0_9ENTR|nr:universal stress protein [Klebsiella michiganensis]ELT9742790.1 universal stress protein [Klebsiella michiganensis]MCY0834283.1 universal stress protein [Klebsiella michiganensis]MDD7826876.1 universal stress protein [Klebsiella michiganensis]MDD7855799.1 universal stress protein [Klebsiella michiganensis]STT08093.1 Universal stress protein G [Klebsiella michiganensis]